MAGELHCAGLVDVDVSGVGGDGALVTAQHRVDEGDVGGGTAYHKVNGSVGGGAFFPDQVRSLGAVRVHTVTGGLFQVGVQQLLQDGGVCPFGVVAVKTNHQKDFLSVGKIQSGRRPASLISV